MQLMYVLSFTYVVQWHKGLGNRFAIRDRTNRPLLFRDRISNCTNLFRPEPNQTEPHTQIRASCRGSFTPQTRDVQILKCCVRISLQILTTDLHPHSPLPTQTPSRSRVSSPSELRKLGQWRRINGCSCGAWSRGDADRTRPSALYYSICSLCSVGQLAECRA